VAGEADRARWREVALAAAAFGVLTGIVASGALATIDRKILDFVQLAGSAWLDLVGSVIHILGTAEVTGAIAVAVAIAWWRHRRQRWWVPLLIVAVVALEAVFKAIVPQPGPPEDLSRGTLLLPMLGDPTPNSFPSGHVARVAFLAVALRWPRPLAAIAILVMGLAKVYLGDHWPSDVIGGWLLGYVVAAGAAFRLRER
jgi:membrane-associated phospholipid phosphatase